MVKTEEDIYYEILAYIKGNKHNRPCTLASIKKELRTSRVVDLVFSRPDIFDLNVEFSHVPLECRKERLLMQFILGNPNRLELLSENEQTLPVLIAYEFVKRKYEQSSSPFFGQLGEKLSYLGKSKDYRDTIICHCDNISSMLNVEITKEKLINIIQEYCNSNKISLEPNENYERKYLKVDFDIDKRIFIFISGMPDSGKTTVAGLLSSIVKKSKNIDSDVLLNRGMLDEPLSSLVNDTDRVVIVSDIDADRLFKKEEIGDALVINVLVSTSSTIALHQHSKYMGNIPYDEYMKCEISKYHFDRLVEPIVVHNDYTMRIYKEVERVIEEIANRLGIDLSSYLIMGVTNNEVEQSSHTKIKHGVYL